MVHLDTFFAQMKAAGYKYNTRNGTAKAMGSFFRWLRRFKHIKENPFDELEPLDKQRDVLEPVPLSFAYEMIRVAESHNSIYGIRDAAIMRLMLTTGARREEVVVLPLSDVDLLHAQIILTGKFGHRREAYLKPTTLTALKRWLEYRPKTLSKTVFVSLHPSKKGIYLELEPEAINDLLIKWRDKAGLPGVSVSPHTIVTRSIPNMLENINTQAPRVIMWHGSSRFLRWPSSEESRRRGVLAALEQQMPEVVDEIRAMLYSTRRLPQAEAIASRAIKAGFILKENKLWPPTNDPCEDGYQVARAKASEPGLIYVISFDGEECHCECLDFQLGNAPVLPSGQLVCKHVLALLISEAIGEDF